MSPIPHTFHYRACAHAFSGNFTRPFQHHIDVQAPISLPTTGGHGHNRVENFQFREFISFAKGYTQVSGSLEKDGSHNTLATAVVEGLNVMDVLTADRIVAHVSSRHHKDTPEGEISLIGSKFENLKIAGCPVNVELDHELLNEVLTFKLAKDSFKNKGKLFTAAAKPFRTLAEDISVDDPHAKDLAEDHPEIEPGDHGPILFSCVKKTEVKCPGVFRRGRHGFYIRGFGRVFLGEVLIKHGEKTITMVRLELGSAVSVSGTVSEASSNGSPWPPPPGG